MRGGAARRLLPAALLLAAAAPVGAAPAPLTNEDVVRLVVHGTPEDVILKEIEARPPAYDLDPGVVVELEKVGVPRTIIEAMRRRQGVVARPAPGEVAPGVSALPGRPPAPEIATGRIEITFAPAADGKPAEVYAISALPKGAPRPDNSEIGTVTELALAVLCTTGDHVPDHWDTLTPIAGGPRHQVVFFRPGSHPFREHGFELRALDRLPAGPIPIAAGRHALLVALAGKQAGSGDWRLLASAAVKVEIADGGSARLSLDARSRLLGSRMTGYRVDEVWTVKEPAAAPAQPETATPPAPPVAAPPPGASGARP